MPRSKRTKNLEDKVAGCLLAGAVGDALGAPVEFMTLAQIRKHYPPAGISEPPVTRGVSPITDDTQMTLFTAEGLLRASTRWHQGGICHPIGVIYHAYLRWLHTQGHAPTGPASTILSGWLITCKPLFACRAPGNTCLSALASGEMGTIEKPINDSKGCGGVMRVAPIGLSRAKDPFRLAAEAAAITHGHPSGYLAAGALAVIIHALVEDAELGDAVERARQALSSYKRHQETSDAIDKALRLAEQGAPSAEALETLGGGWVAEESLAIAIYCALAHRDDLPAALRLAANHSGDSDSTAAITGNILGARLGRQAIPAPWLKTLELRPEIETLATDLTTGYQDNNTWRERYPAS